MRGGSIGEGITTHTCVQIVLLNRIAQVTNVTLFVNKAAKLSF